MAFLNACGFRAASNGTGDFVVDTALDGMYEPAGCLQPVVVDGGEYHYRAESDDKSEHEEGDGVWDSGSSTLARAVVRNSSNSGSAVNFTAAPKVFMGGPISGDMALVTEFTPDAIVALLADKDSYDGESKGFIVQVTSDSDVSDKTTLYVKTADTSGIWSQPIVRADLPTGQGEFAQTFEIIVTTSADETFINPHVAVHYIITDGGMGESLIGFEHEPSDFDPIIPAGRDHIIFWLQQTDPSDTLVSNDDYYSVFPQGVPALSLTATYENPGSWILVRSSIEYWVTVASYDIDFGGQFPTPGGIPTANPIAYQVLVSDHGSDAAWVSDPGLTLSYEEITLDSGSPQTKSKGVYTAFLTTDGSAGAQTVALEDGDLAGQRALLNFATQTDPGDTISVDVTNVLNGLGVQPVSIVADTPNQYALFEWTGAAWEILDRRYNFVVT